MQLEPYSAYELSNTVDNGLGRISLLFSGLPPLHCKVARHRTEWYMTQADFSSMRAAAPAVPYTTHTTYPTFRSPPSRPWKVNPNTTTVQTNPPPSGAQFSVGSPQAPQNDLTAAFPSGVRRAGSQPCC